MLVVDKYHLLLLVYTVIKMYEQLWAIRKSLKCLLRDIKPHLAALETDLFRRVEFIIFHFQVNFSSNSSQN